MYTNVYCAAGAFASYPTVFSRSYCCTQYDRLLAWYCRLSVCLSVYLSIWL